MDNPFNVNLASPLASSGAGSGARIRLAGVPGGTVSNGAGQKALVSRAQSMTTPCGVAGPPAARTTTTTACPK